MNIKIYTQKIKQSLRYLVAWVKQTKLRQRMVSGGLALLMLAVVLFPVLQNNKVEALNAFTQNNWSGGVGTNPSTQYSETNNIVAGSELTLGNNVNSSWCNTARCNNDWQRRKAFVVSNTSGATQTNFTVEVKVSYEAPMQTDFGDIRFVNQAGNADINQYLSGKNDGQEARFLLSGDFTAGDTTYYMYYDNDNAPLVSVGTGLAFEDGFANYNSPIRTSITPNINFSNFNGRPSGIKSTQFSVRWVGKIIVPADNTYTFNGTADDGHRLYVDGVLVLNRWSLVGSSSGAVYLTAGEHDVVIEYQQLAGGASFTLRWQSSAFTNRVIPTTAFSTTDPGTNATVQGLYGEWYNHNDFGPSFGTQWYGGNNWGGSTVSDGVLTYHGDQYLYTYNMTTLDVSRGKVLEFDINIPSGTVCDTQTNTYMFMFFSNSCEDDFYYISSMRFATTNNSTTTMRSNYPLHYDTWYRFRVIAPPGNSSQKYQILYSTDEGKTLTPIEGPGITYYSTSQWGNDPRFYFENNVYPNGLTTNLKSIKAYYSAPVVVAGVMGFAEFKDGYSGQLTSTVIDFSDHAYFGNLLVNSSGQGGVIGVKVRNS
ncbi:hypothetical protein KDA11_02715, partial [Candidatus Saccharibacteria bacterium]|nr:hypothetical protein [Candidatus Saccharibacteria bacterium]